MFITPNLSLEGLVSVWMILQRRMFCHFIREGRWTGMEGNQNRNIFDKPNCKP